MDDAIDAFVRMLDDFRRAASNVHELRVNWARRATSVVPMSIENEIAAIIANASCRDGGGSGEHDGSATDGDCQP